MKWITCATGAQADEQFDAAKEALVNGLIATLTIAKDATPAFPPLQSAVGAVVGIVNVVARMRANVEQLKLLDRYARQLQATLSRPDFRNKNACSKALIQRIDTLTQQLGEITKVILKLDSQPKMYRLLNAEAHAGSIDEYIRQISWAINNFVIGGTVAIELGVGEILFAVGEGFNGVNARLDDLSTQLSSQFTALRFTIAQSNYSEGPTPRYAISARFDFHSQRVCCEGETRIETLATIYQWLLPDQVQGEVMGIILQQPNVDARVFWLSGLAGTGKSTIAQTVAEWCIRSGLRFLGATFFCSRDSSDCSNVQMIFPTISYQLGLFVPEFREKTAQVLKEDPHIHMSLVSHQLRRLIVEPLQKVSSFPPCAVIIDALDECKDDQATSLIIGALSTHVSDLGPLKIILTSRPVANIKHAFHSTGLILDTQHLILHEVPPQTTERDITIYLRKKLAEIRDIYGLDPSWLTENDFSRLLELSNGLFIYAATVVRYIGEVGSSDPKQRLQSLLNGRAASSESPAFNQLDRLYLQVLTSAYPNITRELATRLRIVLGALVLLRDRISPIAMETLMSLKPGTVRTTLAHLHSVVTVPEEDNGIVSLIHPSFQDFITDPNRCSETFLIKPPIQHRLIAQCCLETMITALRKDICNVGQSIPNFEVPELPELIAQRVSPPLQYACVHWALHVSLGEVDGELFGLLEKFSTDNLLNWLEVLSLLGALGGAVTTLQNLREKLAELPLPHSDVLELLYDCQRAVQQSFTGLSVSCLQAYSGLIPFCPESSKLRTHYASQVRGVPRLFSGLEQQWSPCVLTMEGHAWWVTSVAFSPDGRCIASAADDRTVRLWDVVSGAHLHSLGEHGDEVKCVVYSPDGKYIASGSKDKTIIIWDAVIGGHLRTLEGHGATVNTLDFSPNSALLASGSDDCSIQFWDTGRWAKPPTVISAAHQHGVTSIRFSRSGKLLVSGGGEGRCVVWQVDTRNRITQIVHPTDFIIMTVAISPNEAMLAFGDAEKSVFVHSVADGRCIHILQGHSAAMWSVDFSPDGTTLASGSWDHTIMLWDVANGSAIHTLTGHPDQVRSLRFSPDGRRIASCGCDHSVRIWDLSLLPANKERQSGKKKTVGRMRWDRKSGMYSGDVSEPRHTSVVRAMSFSSDGRMLATGSWDHTIRLWNTTDATHLRALRGHEGLVSYLSFTPDGKKLVSAGEVAGSTYALCLWDIKKGRRDATLNGHEQHVWQAKFFRDGQGVLSCSDDGSIRTWDIGLSKRLRSTTSSIGYQGNDPIYCVAVAPGRSLVAFSGVIHNRAIVGLVNIDDQQLVHQIESDDYSNIAHDLTFSADGTRIAATCRITAGFTLWAVRKAVQDSVAPSDAAPEFIFLNHYNVGDRAERIAFSVTERFIVSDAIFHPIRPEHRPHSAVPDDAPPPHENAFFLADDWLWYGSGTEISRRLCWIPSSLRLVRSRQVHYRGTMAVYGNVVAFGTELGPVVLLDMSPCLKASH